MLYTFLDRWEYCCEQFVDALVVENFFKLRFMLKRSKYVVNIFHSFIIAIFLLSLGGCGHKASPYYEQKAPLGDENVKFIIQESQNMPEDTNVSCR